MHLLSADSVLRTVQDQNDDCPCPKEFPLQDPKCYFKSMHNVMWYGRIMFEKQEPYLLFSHEKSDTKSVKIIKEEMYEIIRNYFCQMDIRC